MQVWPTELHNEYLSPKYNIHECSLNDRVLTNINICFSPSVTEGDQ